MTQVQRGFITLKLLADLTVFGVHGRRYYAQHGDYCRITPYYIGGVNMNEITVRHEYSGVYHKAVITDYNNGSFGIAITGNEGKQLISERVYYTTEPARWARLMLRVLDDNLTVTGVIN